ncbi:Uncharacterized protein GBIM_12703 [Gryllus bimaculatus]|nr:Uncharacterized protein GBIM_12703 [Gryllus bimaculatus]
MAGNWRVLTIQSHVVSGYVGNKSATFPLQILGFEVDAINSVQFSNHTGYGFFKGQILSDSELGLKKNKLDNYSHLLTGYVGSIQFLKRIAEVVKYLRTVNPSLIYVCDPVMGDNGKMYVPEDFLPVYRDIIVPLADVVTPNQFEVEILTGKKINNISDAWEAIDWFHTCGVKTVVVSSTELGDEKTLLGLASSCIENQTVRTRVKIPKLPASFTGTGDLFAALFLAWMHITNSNLKDSLERTVSTMQAVLKKTLASTQDDGEQKTQARLELKLIQSKKDIECPSITVKVETVNN